MTAWRKVRGRRWSGWLSMSLSAFWTDLVPKCFCALQSGNDVRVFVEMLTRKGICLSFLLPHASSTWLVWLSSVEREGGPSSWTRFHHRSPARHARVRMQAEHEPCSKDAQRNRRVLHRTQCVCILAIIERHGSFVDASYRHQHNESTASHGLCTLRRIPVILTYP